MIVKKLIRDIRKTETGYLIFCTDMQQLTLTDASQIKYMEFYFPAIGLMTVGDSYRPVDTCILYDNESYFTRERLHCWYVAGYEPDSLTAEEALFIEIHFADGLYTPPSGDWKVSRDVRDLVYRNWLIYSPADSPDTPSGYKVTEKYTKRKTHDASR